MQKTVEKWAKRLLPASLAYEVIWQYRLMKIRRRPKGERPKQNPVRRDLVTLPVQPRVNLLVYWKKLKTGRGPTIILMAYGIEIFRFDFFGPGRGHFHTFLPYTVDTTEHRLFFREQSVGEQIERAVFEIKTNTDYFLQRHPWKRFRELKLDKEVLAVKVEEAREIVTRFLSEVPELRTA